MGKKGKTMEWRSRLCTEVQSVPRYFDCKSYKQDQTASGGNVTLEIIERTFGERWS